MKYIYFVSYVHESGVGNLESSNYKKITSIKELNDLTIQIMKELKIKQCCILNYKLLRTENE